MASVDRYGGRGWWPEIGLVAGFALVTAALAAGLLYDLDLAARDWSDAHRPRPVYLAARVLNFVGSANLVAPIVGLVCAAAAVRLRSVRPVLPVVAGFVLAYGLVVPLKMVADRAAPHSPAADPELIFHHPPGWSYPSGHVANAVYLYGVLAVAIDLLLRSAGRPVLPPAARRLVRVAPAAVVLATTTYLGFHWLTDGLAGLLIGLFISRLVQRLPSPQRQYQDARA